MNWLERGYTGVQGLESETGGHVSREPEADCEWTKTFGILEKSNDLEL